MNEPKSIQEYCSVGNTFCNLRLITCFVSAVERFSKVMVKSL